MKQCSVITDTQIPHHLYTRCRIQTDYVKLLKGAIKTPKSFAHKYIFLFLLSSSVSISVSVCLCVQKFKKMDTD